jgi:RNA polymerase primary sigma factor
MTEALLKPVNPLCEVEPLELAMSMEQARRNLLWLLLTDDEALTLLLKHGLSYLDKGQDICQIVSDKSVDPIIVQDEGFVQPNLCQAVQYLLDNCSDRSRLSNLHFSPALLLEVSGLSLAIDSGGMSFTEERVKLAQAAQKLQQLRQEMITANVGLVAFVANKHKTTVLSFDDLVQEGVVGLIKAVDRFDPYRGFQFSTYAVPWIKQAISRLIVKQEKIVRLPVALAERASVVFEAMRITYMQTERWPSIEQLKLLCDLSEEEIKTIRSYYQANHSLDVSEDAEEDEGLVLMARMKQQQFALPLDELIDNNLSQYLDQVVSTLPDKEAAILTMRFGLKNQTEMTFQAIADKLQVSRERVRQIQNEALKKLKNQFGYELMLFLEPNDSY